MPVTTVRAKLRASLSKKLVPVLIAKGFRGPSDLKGNSLVHEYRRSTDQGTQVLEIQFEKRQLPRFVINSVGSSTFGRSWTLPCGSPRSNRFPNACGSPAP